MARHEHLPIYKAALDLTVHFEKLVAQHAGAQFLDFVATLLTDFLYPLRLLWSRQIEEPHDRVQS